MEMPRPTQEHRKLEQLVGAWTSKEKLHPSPWDPKGGTATGHIRSRVALGGFAVTGDYEQKRDGNTTMARKYIDCREYPSENKCTVAISADADREILEVAVQHAVKSHGHKDTPEFREQLLRMIKTGVPA